jgi:TRAP-type mannitol/chloroaromatic compound transport system permease small subunit
MRFVEAYVRAIDAFNRKVGRFAMYLIFGLMGVLLWSTLTKFAGDRPFHVRRDDG